MLRFMRRGWLALTIALSSSLATPAVALAHGYAHADLAAHESPGHHDQDGQAGLSSPSDSGAGHQHGTIAIGTKSFGPIVALPTTAVAGISWVVLVPRRACVPRAWHIPCSAEPPPNLTRAPPATR